MEFVEGAKPISRYADDCDLGTRARLKLFVKVCDAVEHGHRKRVIHRDLKPDNILIDSDDRLKIID